MTSEKEILSFQKEVTEKLEKKFPDFENQWKATVKSLGSDFIDMVRSNFKNEIKLFDDISKFQLSVVIDNNFIFGQIKNAVENKKTLETTFIYKLVRSKFIDVYAPHKLKEELFDKLKNVLKSNNELGMSYAETLLGDILIQDAYWIDEWKKSNNLIGHIDEDDVPYLALAFHKKSHAIMSNDKIFHHGQGSSKAWKIGDADKAITSYCSGFMSFCIVSSGHNIIKTIWEIIVAVFKIVSETLFDLIKTAGMILNGAFNYINKNVPSEVFYGAIIASVIAALFSEDFRQISMKFFTKTGEFLTSMINGLEQFIQWLISLVQELIEVFGPATITGLEMAAYFAAEYELMRLQIEKLEAERAS